MSDQIKMFIAGEEVVSQNEFTIDEEMLSASSTILNNCYPKSWELTKDYISNFYFPKDYSRFVLAQGEYIHGNEEFAPLEITGKNLFDNVYQQGGLDLGSSGSETVTNSRIRTDFIEVLPNTTYIISRGNNNLDYFGAGLYKEDKSYDSTHKISGGGWCSFPYSITTQNDTKYIRLAFRKEDNSNILPIGNYEIQLEKNNQVTDYVDYNQTILNYNTNIEKECKTVDVYGNTEQYLSSQVDGDNIFNYDSWYVNKVGIGVSNGSISVNRDEIIMSSPTAQDQYNFGTYHMSTTPTDAQISYVKKFGVIVAPSTQFTISYDNLNNCRTQTLVFFYDKDYKYLAVYGNNITTASRVYYTVTPPANSKYMTFRFDNEGYGYSVTTLSIKNIAVKKGTNNTYSPFVPNAPGVNYKSNLNSAGYQNLLKPDRYNDGTYINTARATSSIENEDTFVFTATGSDMFWGTAVNTNTQYDKSYGQIIPVKEGDLIQVYATNPLFTKNYISRYDINKVSIGFIGAGGSNSIHTIPSGVHYISIRFGIGDSVSGTVYKTKFMVAIINRPSAYIPYGKYGVVLYNSNKNLLKPLPSGNEGTLNFSTNENGVTTINGTVGSSSISHFNYDVAGIVLEPGTYTFSSNLTGTVETNSSQLLLRDMNNENLAIINLWVENKKVFTINEKKYLKFYYFYSGANRTYNNNTISVQLEKNSSATEYVLHKESTAFYLLDEPLREVNGVRDRLYVDNGILFVERKIGTLELTGDKGWTYEYATGAGWGGPRFTIYNIDTDYDSAISPIYALSDYFKYTLYPNNYVAYDETFIMRYIAGQKTRIDIVSNELGMQAINANDFKTWLNDKKPIVQYVKKNSTIEPLGYFDLVSSYIGDNIFILNTGIDTRVDLYYYWKNYDVLFAGVVKNSGDISLNPRHPHYCSLQILDYKTFLSESNTLDFVIADKTISEAINMVVNAVSGYGFVVGKIDIDSANDIIGAYSTLNKTAYDVLQYLAEISGSRWRTRVVDSLTMAIDFYDPDNLPQAEDIEYTKEYWENNNIVDITFNYGTRDYRNKQILLSNQVYANINYDETLISNGYSNTFTVQNNIGDIVSIIVDGAEKTIGTNNDKQMGVEADFYYTPGKNVIESNSVYSAGTMIHLTYQPLIKGRQIVYNNSEVDRISMQTETDGVIARYETRNDVLSSDELEKIAKTYIEYKGKAEVIISVKTQNKDLYNIGEVVYFNAPISDLAQNYMVKSKKTEYVVINNIVNLFYIYEMTSSFNSEKAINYFDNQRNKASGNIQEGESITRNVDIESQVNIIWSEGSVSSASVTVTGDNVLNNALNIPFVE